MSTNSGLIDNWINGPQRFCLTVFKSKDCVDLKLNRITIASTYKESGLIWGIPNNQTNDEIINSIKSYASTEDCLILNDPFYSKNQNRLQLYYLLASLESEKFDTNGKLSSLDVIIFFEEFNTENCFKILSTNLERLDWKTNATFWIP